MLQAEAEAKDVINRKTVEGQELQFRVGQLQELADGVRGERDVAAAEASASAQVPQFSLPLVAVCLPACLPERHRSTGNHLLFCQQCLLICGFATHRCS